MTNLQQKISLLTNDEIVNDEPVMNDKHTNDEPVKDDTH
jgi:hypothetical protein